MRKAINAGITALGLMLAAAECRADLSPTKINQYWVMQGRTCVNWTPNPEEPGIKAGCISNDNPSRQELNTLLRDAFITGKRCALEHHKVNFSWPDEITSARCVSE